MGLVKTAFYKPSLAVFHLAAFVVQVQFRLDQPKMSRVFNPTAAEIEIVPYCLDSSVVERRIHNPEVEGSNPSRGICPMIKIHSTLFFQ